MLDGDHVLYRFFQDGLTDGSPVFAGFAALAIEKLAVWMPPDAYYRMPVLVPYAVRDKSCRGDRVRGVPDEWGSPNSCGFLRDDNTLIKAVPRSLVVAGPKSSPVHGGILKTGFVASHVWRYSKDPVIPSTADPLLNSFVPNLVWLPRQIAKLSDREGSAFQLALQATSVLMFRAAPVHPKLKPVVEDAWSRLTLPVGSLVGVDISRANRFVANDRFYRFRAERLQTVIAALACLESGMPVPARVITSRYAAGLTHVPSSARDQLRQYLSQFEV